MNRSLAPVACAGDRNAPIRRLRVLHVIDSLVLGGAEQMLVTLAQYIDATRYDLRVCSLTPIDENGPIVRGLRARAIPIYCLAGARRHDPRHVSWLATLARRQRIDVLHTHLSYANITGLLAGALTRRPVICTLHSVRDWYRSLGWLKRELQIQAVRWGARMVIACSSEVGESAQRRLRVPTGKLVVVPNGIDTHAFAIRDPATVRARRAELLSGRRGPLMVTVGNLLPAKGHQYLVEATARLLDRFDDLRVVIVGRDGDNGAMVRDRIKALRVDRHILLAGQRSDIADILAAADLFVFPSVYEGLPLALLEAMAAGLPVVASEVGEIPRVLEEGLTGRLVPPGDAGALAEAIGEVLAQEDGGRHMGIAAQAHVQATYGGQTWARRVESIYAKVAQGRPEYRRTR